MMVGGGVFRLVTSSQTGRIATVSSLLPTAAPWRLQPQQRSRSSTTLSRGSKMVLDSPTCAVYAQPVGVFGMNQHLVVCKSTGSAAMVDTGDVGRLWSPELSLHSATVTKLLLTHAHIDHVFGLGAAHREFDAPVYLHPLDVPNYTTVREQGQIFGVGQLEHLDTLPAVEDLTALSDGEVVDVGEVSLDVIHTPGHAPGHVCFHCPSEDFLIAGDLIFQGSIGRTDLRLCNPDHMQQSLRKVATSLPRDTLIFPGHMGQSTLSTELQNNPWLREFANLRSDT